MLNEIINKEILRSKRLLLKLKFCNWIKNGKIIKDKISDEQKNINSNENAKIIQNSISFKEKYEYIEEKPINSGGYTQIYRIRDKKVSTEYVLKKIRKNDPNANIIGTIKETFENELKFLIEVKGTNIINIIDYYSMKMTNIII